MRKTWAGIFLTLGFLLVLVGVSSYLYQEESVKFNGKIVSGDWREVLDYAANLRAKPWFWTLKVIPNLNGDLLMKEGWSLYKIGDREGAVKKFREAAELSGNRERAWARFNAATIDLTLETVEQAILDYEKVLSHDPGHIAAQKNLEILQMIKEERVDLNEGDKDSDGDEEKQKKRSRTKDKLEYRDGDGDGDNKSSPTFRY